MFIASRKNNSLFFKRPNGERLELAINPGTTIEQAANFLHSQARRIGEAAEPVLSYPVKIGAGIFREGVKVSTVLDAARRAYDEHIHASPAKDSICFPNNGREPSSDREQCGESDLESGESRSGS